ncbi:tyrosine-type recombinase/integrase [Planomicrobium sp. YIM 101495]|uniref:tyrosine-type recombinase/integrase n=1 Tax=Planomicrobium sp. YIM 101495 TaxID=2665160 RepID=UPI0018ABEA36|nr:tyrosine-type recombinase/integrase [Planomicrobium sp. YIM 101495]
MASFRKRGKTWQYRIRVKDPYTNKMREFTEAGFKTKGEAKQASLDRERKIMNGMELGEIVFADFAQHWLDNHVKGKLRPNTYRTYRNALEKHAIPYFGVITLRKLTPKKYQEFIDSLTEKNLSIESARRVHNVCYQVFKRAIIYKYLVSNPAQDVHIRKNETTDLKFLDPSFLSSFYKQAYKRGQIYGLFFKCLFESGLRKGEAAALQWSDIDWKEGTLNITETLDFQPEEGDPLLGPVKKLASKRIVKMRKSFMIELQEHLKYQNQRKLYLGDAYRHDLNLVFCRDDGTPLPKSTLYNAFKSCLEKVGAPVLPIHSTRHTHAVMLIEAGADMKYIQERLGHGSFAITSDTYSHVSKTIEKRSIDKFEDYMQNLK